MQVDSPELKTNLCAAYTEAGQIKDCQEFILRNKVFFVVVWFLNQELGFATGDL